MDMILGEIKVDGAAVVPVPKIGMTFVSEKEMREYCTKYAESAGFDIAKRSTKCGEDGKQRYFSLACSRNGHTVYTSKNSLHQKSTSSKTNCKAKINVAVKSDDVFMITRVFLDHNHELTPGKARYFRYNKAFKPYCKRKLDLNEMANNTNMCFKRSLNSIRVEAGQHNNINNIVTSPQAKKQRVLLEESTRRKHQVESGDVEALVHFFSGMQARDPSFFYTIDVNEEGRIQNMFWADSRSRAAYESFPDVVTFDTTYLTSNDYSLPLVSFLGVNHHGQSILLGCGLIFSEDTKTFIWLLKSWLMCMHGKHPKTLVSDEVKSIQSAIAKVFPDSNNILCLSRVMDKLEGLQINKGIVKALKNAVYGSFTCGEFEESWRKTIYEFNLNDNQWLRTLYEVRKGWVPVYMKSVFTAGLMSQKVAIAKEFFDEFVNQKTTVKQFVEQYDKAVEKSIEKEKNADFASSSFVLPTMTNHPIEKQLQKVYTNDIFKQFQEEWRGLIFCNASISKTNGFFDVAQSVYNESGMFLKEMTCEVVLKEEQSQINCSCCLFESRGILCRHIISVLIKRNKHEVPSCYIPERWRKDIKRRYKDHFGYMSFNFINIERRRYDELNPLLFEVQQIAIQSKEKCELLTKILKQVKAKMLPVDIV